MKKKYEKPGLYIESFALSQSVAVNCNLGHNKGDGTLGEPNYSDGTTCGWTVPGGVNYWTDALGSTKCNGYQVQDNDDIEFGCYNNPSPNNAIFSYS